MAEFRWMHGNMPTDAQLNIFVAAKLFAVAAHGLPVDSTANPLNW